MAKYIKCDCCEKRIPFGEEVYRFRGYAGLYCSGECFAEAYGEVQELDFQVADNSYKKVYDDEEEMAIRKAIEQTKIDISNLERKLKGLEFDLKAYE